MRPTPTPTVNRRRRWADMSSRTIVSCTFFAVVLMLAHQSVPVPVPPPPPRASVCDVRQRAIVRSCCCLHGAARRGESGDPDRTHAGRSLGKGGRDARLLTRGRGDCNVCARLPNRRAPPDGFSLILLACVCVKINKINKNLPNQILNFQFYSFCFLASFHHRINSRKTQEQGHTTTKGGFPAPPSPTPC